MNARPNIIVVDDDPAALASLLDALTRRYGGDYRVIPHLSALEALAGLERLGADRGVPPQAVDAKAVAPAPAPPPDSGGAAAAAAAPPARPGAVRSGSESRVSGATRSGPM